MNPHYTQVARRAAHGCEYCHAPEVLFNFPFEVEHIHPASRGGLDVESNWALSCRSCNLYKSDNLDAIDPQTNSRVPLFHPRQGLWKDHFILEETTAILLGLTPIGRATIERLQMNRPAQINARRQWMRLGLFPAR
jgi:HNH endonuclease